MESKKIKKLLAEVKNICPLDVSVMPACRGKFLMVIKYPPREVDLHDWAIEEVHSLQWRKIFPLINKAGFAIRTLYCCDNKFVLYVPMLGINVLYGAEFSIQYECFGYEERSKYVGTCEDIDRLTAFLKERIR